MPSNFSPASDGMRVDTREVAADGAELPAYLECGEPLGRGAQRFGVAIDRCHARTVLQQSQRVTAAAKRTVENGARPVQRDQHLRHHYGGVVFCLE